MKGTHRTHGAHRTYKTCKSYMSYEPHESYESYKSHTKRETELRKNADCKIHFRTGHAGISGLGMVDDDSQRLPRDRSGDLEIGRPCRFHRTVEAARQTRVRTESRGDGMVRKDARHRRALAQRRARNFEAAERMISRVSGKMRGVLWRVSTEERRREILRRGRPSSSRLRAANS